MAQFDQNINDESDLIGDLIDIDSIDSDDTWFLASSDDGDSLDFKKMLQDWRTENGVESQNDMDPISKKCIDASTSDKRLFDSRTFVRPRKPQFRPSIHNIVDPAKVLLNNLTLSPANNYLTYNKHSSPMSPMLRLATFNVDANTTNSGKVKEYTEKRMLKDETMQLDESPLPSKPIKIDFSQPANNLHHTFKKGMSNIMNENESPNLYRSGEWLTNVSPPSLVSSTYMEHSGNFHELLEGRKSIVNRDSGIPTGRESEDPMLCSMSLSTLEDKDMNTSFCSKTNESLFDSMPPSLVSSMNSNVLSMSALKEYPIESSSIMSTSTPKDSLSKDVEPQVVNCPTYTSLENSTKLLSARPRCPLYSSPRMNIRSSESYTKCKDEGSQIETAKKNSENDKNDNDETITIHYSKNFADKENLNNSFEKDDAFYNDISPKDVDSEKRSLNITYKQELNEIIQARQKLSLARKGLPTEHKPVLPNQVDNGEMEIIQVANQTVTVPKQSIENASELLAKRKAVNGNSQESTRESPRRNLTFKRPSPSKVSSNLEVTHVIDINSATMNLIDSDDRTMQPEEEWNQQQPDLVASSETVTFSSPIPSDFLTEAQLISSTPAPSYTKSNVNNFKNMSPLLEASYTVKTGQPTDTTFSHATYRKSPVKKEISVEKSSPEKKTAASPSGPMGPPNSLLRKTGLPTSKLRQYSSHKELNRISAAPSIVSRPSLGQAMTRRAVYSSNPALSCAAPTAIIRRDSYTVTQIPGEVDQNPKPQRPVSSATPTLVRQGTETLRREKPPSQQMPNKELRPSTTFTSIANGAQRIPVPLSRQTTVTTLRSCPSRPSSAGVTNKGSVPVSAGGESKSSNNVASSLPRPSRLPAPKRTIRPPSVYSLAPTTKDIGY